MLSKTAKFRVGQVVHHKMLDYRGVVIDVDPCFQDPKLWEELMSDLKNSPIKNDPWYQILVDEADFAAYVAEEQLEEDPNKNPISHPQLHQFFSGVDREGIYISKRSNN